MSSSLQFPWNAKNSNLINLRFYWRWGKKNIFNQWKLLHQYIILLLSVEISRFARKDVDWVKYLFCFCLSVRCEQWEGWWQLDSVPQWAVREDKRLREIEADWGAEGSVSSLISALLCSALWRIFDKLFVTCDSPASSVQTYRLWRQLLISLNIRIL